MAILNDQTIAALFSGMLGGTLVLRRYGNKTVVSAAPAKRRITSEAQKAQQQRFTQAVAKAKELLKDPEYYALCKNKVKPGQTVLNVAVKEMLQLF